MRLATTRLISDVRLTGERSLASTAEASLSLGLVAAKLPAYLLRSMTANKISTADFLGLQTQDNGTITVPMVSQLMGGRGNSLFGGAGLAAGLIAFSEQSGRPPVWMTAQFVAAVSPPDELLLTVEELARGRSSSQGRVTGTVDGRPVIALLGATGSRTEHHQGQWRTIPDAKSPEESEPVVRDPEMESMHDHVEVRMARGMFAFTETGTPTSDSTSLLWARMPEVVHDGAALAILADYMASAVGNSLGQRVNCSSLDNTIRFTGPIDPAEADGWILCENNMEFTGAGFASGTCYLWSTTGRLLAIASQSMTVSNPVD